MSVTAPLRERYLAEGPRWCRQIPVNLQFEDGFKTIWTKRKIEFFQRGFTVKMQDSKCILQQVLVKLPDGSYSLTDNGETRLRLATTAAPQAPTYAVPVFAELPNGLEKILWEYQRLPARQIYRALSMGKSEWGYPGAVDLSDMGVGKTAMDLAAALATGRKPVVICPKVGEPGWRKMFAIFNAEPYFIGTYEALRGGWRTHIVTMNGDEPHWHRASEIVLVMDEAQSCFPYETLINTENGPIPIGVIVEQRLEVNVMSFDLGEGVSKLMPITNWFRNPNAPLIKIHHEHGSFTCTADHRIWTIEEGWIQAGNLNSTHHLLNAKDEADRTAGAALSELQRGVLRMELPKTAILLKNMRNCLQGENRDGCEANGCPQTHTVREDERRQPDEKCGTSPEDDGKPQREKACLKRGKRIVKRSPNGVGVFAESGSQAYIAGSYGVCDTNQSGEGHIQTDSESLQIGHCHSTAETVDRGGWAFTQANIANRAGQEKDDGFRISRVERVEVLEQGDYRELGSGNGEGKLYDFEVAGTHCYFAENVLVHNCRHDSTLTVRCFAAAVKQGIPIIMASATIATSPLEFRFAGRIVGLHQGGQDWDRFLARHGCTRRKVGEPWKWEPNLLHLDRINSELFPRRGARVRKEDLGEECPETQIEVLTFDAPEAKEIEKMWQQTLNYFSDQLRRGVPESAVRMARQKAHQKIWQHSEMALVPYVAERIRKDIDDFRSVAAFMSFNLSRLELAKRFGTNAGFYGGQHQKVRQHWEKEFQTNRQHVLINNIRAGGASVSLHDTTGERPRTAYIFPTDRIVDMVQATGRVDRVGGKSKSLQFIPCFAGSVTENMVHRTRKKMLQIGVINDGANRRDVGF
jgi:hypothetical protein